MTRNLLPDWIRRPFSFPVDNPELLEAQCAALSRLIPFMYFILVTNSWMLTATFIGMAPPGLTVGGSALLTVLCLVRLVIWWRMRREAFTTTSAIRELRRTNVMAAVLAIAFLAWGLRLFPYGDAYARGHVGFFLAVSMIGAMLCLIHIPSAALLIAMISGSGFVGFFVWNHVSLTFTAMSIGLLLAVLAMVVIILIQNRDFARMVNAQTEARRREREQSRLLRMINDMPIAVMTVEPDTLNINYANEASKNVISRIEHMLPISADSLLGTSIDVFHRAPEHQRRLLADPANLPHQARIQLGTEVLDLRASAVTADDGSYIGPMLTWAIVTNEVEAERRIHQLAHYDTLTGLANRNTFHQRLETRLASGDGCATLLFIDLDGFKLVNDTKGHHVGDLLLGQVASRLRAECREPDMVVGRLGGDEFAVLIPDNDPALAARVADALVDRLSALYRLDDDRQVRIGASVGIALAPEHGEDAGTLLTRADMALYAAKTAGKRTSRVFHPEMETRVKELVRIEAELRSALDDEEGLFVFYQPIIDIASRRMTAREALIRWHHPERGWIAPSEFVPVAEQSGLIDRLGLFVLHRACHDAATWQDDVRVAINVSAAQLGKGTLAPAVQAALAATALSPDRLELEITETALLNGELDVVEDLRRLRAVGVRIALDDFGTGYSSLAHLRAFPFDKIKIDGSFVRDAVDRPDCAAVVRAVAELGRRLGVTTVAEGVETRAHLDRVTREGCVEVQGYFVGRPMPGDRDARLIDLLEGGRQDFRVA